MRASRRCSARRDNGRWLVAPREPARITRRYRPNTLILETHFETDDGAATLVDFMPFHAATAIATEIVRIVIGTRGKLAMHTELILRFGYGAVVPWVTRLENGALRAIAGPDMVVLRTPVHVKGKDMTTVGEFTVSRGETIPLVLTYSRSHQPLPAAIDPTASLEATEKFWKRMVGEMPAGRRMVRRGTPFGDHAQGAHLWADRRHRRGADHVAAGAARRRAQLGLSLSAGCATPR